MMELKNGWSYTLASGREVCANNGIFGLDPELGLTEGYDTNLDPDNQYGHETPWTPEERSEVANMMIRRWIKWRDENPVTFPVPQDFLD